MQLRINAVNNKVLENLESLLYSDDKELAKWFMTNLPWEVYEKLSPQYELQVISSMQIRKLLWWWIFKNIKWIYFWTEQCEFLLPTLSETKKAIELLKEFDKKYTSKEVKQFVFISPYYWNPTIRTRMIEILWYLNENAHHINTKTKQVEIVVNDFWTINLLKQYPNLKPLIWRILIKTLKNPIVDTFWLEENLHVAGESIKNKSLKEVKEIKHEIAENQKQWFARSALNNDYFLKFLSRNEILRAWIDYMEHRENLYNTKIDIDIYYPYALLFVGRLCDTSAIENIRRWYYPTDELCPRTCRKYDMFIKDLETVWYKLIQRWNAQYRSQTELELPLDTVEKYNNRLIYTPMI